MKKVEKNPRPFKWPKGYIQRLNQMPYNFTVEVRNTFKGLDLTDRVPMNYGLRFVTLYRRQGSNHPQEKNTKN